MSGTPNHASGTLNHVSGTLKTRRWSLERVRRWSQAQPWRVGCNFIPSTAVNQLEMWQAESFDPETIERELGWAGELGLNLVRVYLHDLAWEQDPEGLLQRIERVLELAAAQRIGVMLVLFDDVWGPEPRVGPQPAPYPGRHNSGWVQSPGRAAREGYATSSPTRERLERYVTGIIGAFARDERVLIWDLYNEPGGFPEPFAEPADASCLPLLRDVFCWARDASPDQPLTSGLWWSPLHEIDPRIQALQLEGSDLVSFHHYGPPDDLRRLIKELHTQTDRPLICTEYLARGLKSRFETHLPIFREHGIGAVHWGLVSGKTQTIYPWWSWRDTEPKGEPEVWFHDVLRTDGTPFDPAEARTLRELLAPTRAGS